MRHAHKERLPVEQPRTVEKIIEKPPTAGAKKPGTAKTDWIEHRDWHGEGVVGDSHTD